MTKFNKVGMRPQVKSAVTSEHSPSGRTFEGAPGYARDAKSELFLLAVTNFVSENTFYEKANSRDERFENLVAQVAIEDGKWLQSMIRWLRNDANMRSASIVAACVAVKARLDYKLTDNRGFIDAACSRADEPGDILAYWLATFGKPIPKPIKRGLSDAAQRLYTERNFIKYDSAKAGVRFGDVIDLCHADPAGPNQSALYQYAIEKRHNRDSASEPDFEKLPMIAKNRRLNTLADENKRAILNEGIAVELLAEAGMTWESVSSWGPMTAKAWESIIPSMGYMALLRNLRNFDEAGVSDSVADKICQKLSDPVEVAKSRQLPYRFYTAHKMVNSFRWAQALDSALTLSLNNIPVLSGRTLVLVDTSGSMKMGFSKDGTVARWDAATLFGIALARRCADASLYSFSSVHPGYSNVRVKKFPVPQGASLLKLVDRWDKDGYFIGAGTDTFGAIGETYDNHDRVVIFTDEQTYSRGVNMDQLIGKNTRLYVWNLAGYQHGMVESGSSNRHVFGGLNDKMFTSLHMLENMKPGVWPWENQPN